MPTETALSRERAKRCEWCAKGSRPLFGTSVHKVYPMNAGSGAFRDPSIKGPFSEYLPCGCTDISDSDLYEELAKERDELKADFDWLDAAPGMEQMVHTFVQTDGPYVMWRIKRAWGPSGSGRTLRDAIRAAREKEKA